MNALQLKELIIEPVLKSLQLYSNSAVNLLLGTAAVESNLGEYLEQISIGIAKGIYQIEMETHNNIVNYIIKTYPHLYGILSNFKISSMTNEENLIGNLYYATAIARLIYFSIKRKLPPHNDIEGLAKYWKKYYNTEKGKGTVQDFIDKYTKLVKII